MIEEAGGQVHWLPTTHCLDLQGCTDGKNIWVNPRLTSGQRCATLAHEYIHIVLGHVGHQTPQIESLVDTKAAKLIITEQQYKEAEIATNGTPQAIAETIEIPLWTVNAWKK